MNNLIIHNSSLGRRAAADNEQDILLVANNKKRNNSVPFPFQGTSGRTVRVTSFSSKKGGGSPPAEFGVPYVSLFVEHTYLEFTSIPIRTSGGRIFSAESLSEGLR